MSTKIAGMTVKHIEHVHKETQKDTRSFADTIAQNIAHQAIGAVVGQILPCQAQGELPTTKTLVARLNGAPMAGVELMADKPKIVSNSCIGFHHPVDFHMHVPSQEEYSGRPPTGKYL